VAGESFQPIEAAGPLEGLGVQLDRGVRGEHPCTTAGVFLCRAFVRCAVGAEEESRIAAGRGLDERRSIGLALQYRQAIEMRPDAARENGVAIVQEVLRGERGGDARPGRAHEVRGACRRDVFEHDGQCRVPLEQGRQHIVDEARLAIEDIDIRAGRLAVHLERHAEVLHAGERGVDAAQVGDAQVRMGGRARRIELDAVHDAGALRTIDLLRRRGVGQVQRHQRRETGAGGQRREDPIPVGGGLRGGRDGRPEIGHDDGAAELPRGEPHDRSKGGAVPQMQMPVVGPAQGQGVHAVRRTRGCRGAGAVPAAAQDPASPAAAIRA